MTRVRTRPAETSTTAASGRQAVARQRRIQITDEPVPMQRIRDEIARNTSLPIDAAIDRSVRTGQPIPITPPAPMQVNTSIPPAVDTTGLDTAEEGVSNRMTSLSEHPNAQREYRLRLLHRMLVRQLSFDLIARALNVSIRQVYNLREDLYRQLREEATNKDLPTYVGFTDAFYNDMIGMAVRMASSNNTSPAVNSGRCMSPCRRRKTEPSSMKWSASMTC